MPLEGYKAAQKAAAEAIEALRRRATSGMVPAHQPLNAVGNVQAIMDAARAPQVPQGQPMFGLNNPNSVVGQMADIGNAALEQLRPVTRDPETVDWAKFGPVPKGMPRFETVQIQGTAVPLSPAGKKLVMRMGEASAMPTVLPSANTMTKVYHGTNWHNLPDVLEWIRRPDLRPDPLLSGRAGLWVTDSAEKAARYANAQVTRAPSLAYGDLMPKAAVIEIHVPRDIAWMKRGENYAASLDATEHWLLPSEPGLTIANVRAAIDPFTLNRSHITAGNLKIVQPNPALLDRLYHAYPIRALLESMGLGNALQFDIKP